MGRKRDSVDRGQDPVFVKEVTGPNRPGVGGEVEGEGTEARVRFFGQSQSRPLP